MPPTAVKRRYDTTNRMRKAAGTQLRIIRAARTLFLRDGYAATTIAGIASEARVAVQTVYASLHSKREILQRILDLAVSGEDEQLPVLSSSRWQELDRETDPAIKLALFVRLHTEICQREADVFAIMSDAAGSDPEVRALMHDNAQRRYKDQLALARSFRTHHGLRDTITTGRAADVIWTLANEGTYLALVRQRDWTPDQYAHWLTEQLAAAILATPREAGNSSFRLVDHQEDAGDREHDEVRADPGRA